MATTTKRKSQVSLDYFRDELLPSIDMTNGTDAKAAILEYLEKKMIEVVDEEGEPIDMNATLVIHGPKVEEETKQEGDEEDDEAESEEDMAKRVLSLLAKKLGEDGEKRTIDVKVKGLAAEKSPTFGWKSMGEQLNAIRKSAYKGHATDDRLKIKAPQGLNESSDADGGFLLAPEYSSRILEIMHEEENLLDRTDNFDINGPSVKIRAYDETSRATGSRRGGVRGYWLAEADTLTASKPKFRMIDMAPHKLGVLVYTTEELIDDGGTMLEQMVANGAAAEINFLTGDAIVNGDGAGKPLGILNAPCKVSVSKETGQAASTVVSENIVKMYARLHRSARSNAVWLINQDIEPQLHTLNLPVGTGGALVYMPPGGLSDKPYGTLYGRPVIATEFNATLGTEGDIILADLKQYLAVTRGAIKSAMSMHVQFLTDELAFRFTFRVDGQPWWNSALTPFKGSNTQSPFITLATRS